MITSTTPLDTLPHLIRVADAARLLDCSKSVVYGMVKHGRLHSVRLNRLLRITKHSLIECIKANGQ